MNLFYYLLEANTYLVVFYVFYRIVLKNETFYNLNRFYLLGTSALAFLLPLIKISGFRKAEILYLYNGPVTQQPVGNFWNAFHITLTIYLLVAVFFLARLGVRLLRISSLIKQGDLKPQANFKMVEIKDNDLSFSFMNYLFINPDLPKLETIIKHEQVHIRQRHSLDILFFEILQVVNWFNPMIGKIQDDVRAVHEFIADEETALSETSAADYALFLIQNSYGTTQQSLSSAMFNRTLLKDRIVMLNQQRSAASAKYKYTLLLLLLPAMLCTSAMAFAKDYGFVDLLPQKVVVVQDTAKKVRIAPPPPPAPPKSKSQSLKGSPPLPAPPVSKKLSQQAPPPPPAPPKEKKVEKLKVADPGRDKQAPPPPPMPPQPKAGLKQAPPPPPMPPVKKENKTSSVEQKVSVPYDVVKKVDVLKEVTIVPANTAKTAIDVAVSKEVPFEKAVNYSVDKAVPVKVKVDKAIVVEP